MLLYTLPVLGLALLAGYIVSQVLFSPLRSFPGPFVAKFTHLWRFVDVWKGQHQHTLRRLHEKHGEYVRIGPNLVSISDPHCVKLVYTIKGDFVKSPAYSAADVLLQDGRIVPTSFSVRNEKEHSEIIRPIQKLFNLSNVTTYEERVDHVVDLLIGKVNTFARTGEVVDLWQLALFTAYDTVGCMTFGSPYGYLEHHRDFNGIIGVTRRAFAYYAVISQIPWLDRLLAKSRLPYVPNLFETFETLRFGLMKSIKDRCSQKDGEEVPRDLMEDFIHVGGGKTHGNFTKVVSWMSGLIVAGSDTTAITLASTLHEIISHSDVYRRLQNEIDNASLPHPTPYNQAKDNLPYLGAVLKESLRCNSANQMPLERIVPTTGFMPSEAGPFIPPGTIIGCTSSIVHRSTEYYGADADEFKPERWLPLPGETNEETTRRIARMNEVDLSFGAGRRVCIGKFVALVQIWKILVAIVSNFDIELAGGEKWEWKTRTDLNAYPDGLPVRVKRRQAKSTTA